MFELNKDVAIDFVSLGPMELSITMWRIVAGRDRGRELGSCGSSRCSGELLAYQIRFFVCRANLSIKVFHGLEFLPCKVLTVC